MKECGLAGIDPFPVIPCACGNHRKQRFNAASLLAEGVACMWAGVADISTISFSNASPAGNLSIHAGSN